MACPCSRLSVAPKGLGPQTPCTPTSCTGFYVGAGVIGNGTNADIIGNGLSGSVFGAGAAPHLTAGYQLANGTYFLAVEGSIGYTVNSVVTAGGLTGTENGVMGMQTLKAGMALSSPPSKSMIYFSTFFAGTEPTCVPVTEASGDSTEAHQDAS